MKTLELKIKGGAAELVVGTLSPDELDRMHEVMKENDLAEEEEDGTFDYDYSGFFWDSSLCSEADLSEWHDIDNLFHEHGATPSGSTITITDKATETVVYEEDLSTLLDLLKTSPEQYKFDASNIEKGSCIFSACSAEKGDAFCGEFEIADDANFDPMLLSFSHVEVEIDGCYLGDIIEYLSYDDEDIDNDGYKTYGKSTDFDLTFFDEAQA